MRVRLRAAGLADALKALTAREFSPAPDVSILRRMDWPWKNLGRLIREKDEERLLQAIRRAEQGSTELSTW